MRERPPPFAMQKVEGSSPFIRSKEKPRKRGFFCLPRWLDIDCVRAGVASGPSRRGRTRQPTADRLLRRRGVTHHTSLRGDARAPSEGPSNWGQARARTSAKRCSARTPKRAWRESFAFVVAGLVRPQRKRARWRGVPSAVGCSAVSSSRTARSSSSLRGRGRLRKPLRGAGQAKRAVAARIGAGLAEVADERLHLAAVVLDEGDDALDPLRLRLLAAVEALGEAVAQLVERRRLLEQREALAHVGDLQLDEAPLLEVAERCDDRARAPRPARRLAGRCSSRCGPSCRSRARGAGSRRGRRRRPRTRRPTRRSPGARCSPRRTACPARGSRRARGR